MGQVFSPPAEIGKFEFDYSTITGGNSRDWMKAEEEYTNKIVEYAKKHGKGEFRGRVIQFGVADGYAVYVIMSINPVKLIHVPTGDSYQFPYVNRLTSADIRNKAGEAAAWAKIFADHKAGA